MVAQVGCFSAVTFELLAAIAQTPTAAFYLEHKNAFKEHVEGPLRQIMRGEVSLLPGMMTGVLETERNLFSRFLKNDFGKGGAWSNYWGAFYPKGGRRISDVQLAVWINRDGLGISFYIGDNGDRLARTRFEYNCARYQDELVPLMKSLDQLAGMQYAKLGRTTLNEDGQILAEQPMSLWEWLADPKQGDYWAFAALTPSEVMNQSGQDLSALAAKIHMELFPLALLAMQAEPLDWIRLFNS